MAVSIGACIQAGVYAFSIANTPYHAYGPGDDWGMCVRVCKDVAGTCQCGFIYGTGDGGASVGTAQTGRRGRREAGVARVHTSYFRCRLVSRARALLLLFLLLCGVRGARMGRDAGMDW